MPTPNSKRNYKKEHARQYKTDKQKKDQIKKVQTRREFEKNGRVKKKDGKEIDHKKPLAKGGSHSKGNLRVVSRHTNRVKSKK